MPRIVAERDWPIVPVSLFLLSDLIYEIAKAQWHDVDGPEMPPYQVDNPGALQSAVMEPYQAIGGHGPLYPTIPSKAACLFRGLVKNHALRDGNKRLAVTATGIFLQLNGRSPTFSPIPLANYALRVARHHGAFPVPRIERWIRTHSERMVEPELSQRRAVNERILRQFPYMSVDYMVNHEDLSSLRRPIGNS